MRGDATARRLGRLSHKQASSQFEVRAHSARNADHMTQLGAHLSRSAFPAFAARVIAGSAILAASAQIAVPIGFSPVPVSAQTLGLALVVALFGTRASALAAIAYLAEGACGLPVFSQHQAGPLWLAGPTGGYLWAFPIAAFAMGWMLDRGLSRTFPGRFFAFAAGTCIVLASGVAWLAHFLGGVPTAIAAGAMPFAAGEVIKVTLAALIAPAAARLRTRETSF
jgi:biotin transport system substrate-specific component